MGSTFERHYPQPAYERRGLVETQENIGKILDPISVKPHIADGFLLEDVELVFGTTDIAHKLGRDIRGWYVTRKQASPCSVWADMLAAQSLTTTGDEKVLLDNTLRDEGSNFDAVNSKIILPHDGLYNITFRGAITNGSLFERLAPVVFLNGSRHLFAPNQRSGATSNDFISVEGAYSFDFAKDDELELYLNKQVGGTIALIVASNYMIVKSVDELDDDQAGLVAAGLLESDFLRLRSSRVRTVDLVVF